MKITKQLLKHSRSVTYTGFKSIFLIITFCFAPTIAFSQHLLPDGFEEKVIVEKLNPTALTIVPDGRVFICDKSGKVFVVKNDILLKTPFITLQNVDDFNERGLEGIAFDPDFAANGFFYLYYTRKDQTRNRISRFKATGDVADPDSEVILLDLEEVFGGIHNGGAMNFGADGKLYIATGDGSIAENAQNMTNLLGKILRINPDGSIPVDNPFYATATGNNRAIWAIGLRNPFNFDIQPGTGKIFANDVGLNSFEEINEIRKGANYGWSIIEGPKTNQIPPDNYAEPIHAYSHEEGCCIIGAAFYNPQIQQFPPQYTGRYFFGDYCDGYVKVLNPATGRVESTFMTGLNRPVDFAIAADGSFYYLERAGLGGGSQDDNTGSSNGSLWKINYTGSAIPVISLQPKDAKIAEGDSASFSISASGTAPLTYQWQRNNTNITGANNGRYTLKNAVITDNQVQFRCIVSNAAGSDTSQSAVLTVIADTPPVANIHTPLAGSMYRAGDTLYFAGIGTDVEDGNLPLPSLTWWIDFHHDTHTHPGLPPVSGINSGKLIIPRVGELSDNVWYRVYLKVTDSKGLSQTTFRDIYPEKVTLTVESEPSGITINADGAIKTTPASIISVKGISRSLEAPDSYSFNGKTYRFSNWSNGLTDRMVSFNAPDNNTGYKAIYELIPISDGTGLFGRYYDKSNKNFSVPVVLTRTDPVINFDWGNKSPAGVVGDDNFSILWTGQILPLFTGSHTFYLKSDGGCRLWIDNQVLIDNWATPSTVEKTAVTTLNAGKKYNIMLEYFEDTGDAFVQLAWSHAKIAKQIIPTTQLFPLTTITSTELAFFREKLQLFPVPAGNLLNIHFFSDKTEMATIRVTNLLGQVLYEEEKQIQTGNNNFELNLQAYAQGLYLFWVSDSNCRIGQKFSKN